MNKIQKLAEQEAADDYDSQHDLNKSLYRWIPMADSSRPQDYKLTSITWFHQCRVLTLQDIVRDASSLATLLNNVLIYKVNLPQWVDHDLVRNHVKLCWTEPGSLFCPFPKSNIRPKVIDDFWLVVVDRFKDVQEYIPHELLQDERWHELYSLARCDSDEDFLLQISHEKLADFFTHYTFLDLSRLMKQLVKRQQTDEFASVWLEAAIKADSSLIMYVMEPTYEQCFIAYCDSQVNLQYCPAKYWQKLKQDHQDMQRYEPDLTTEVVNK